MARDVALDYHHGRVLLLLKHFGPSQGHPLKGLTKLAKLDFLLRYPMFTERILRARGIDWVLGTEPTDSERLAVESRMMRYKYGPWDNRYYPILGSLIGLDLIGTERVGRTFSMHLTEFGAVVANKLSVTLSWAQVDLRAGFLQERFDVSGSSLKAMIYRELPDVVDRPYRASI